MTPPLPATRRRLPVAALSAVTGVLGAGLVVSQLGGDAWPVVAMCAIIAAAALALWPRPVLSGALTLVLAAHHVWRYQYDSADSTDHVLMRPLGPLSAALVLLLAGAHLLHALTTLLACVPRDGLLEVRALRPVLVRFAAVQVPVQLLAAAVLHVTDPAGGLGGRTFPVAGAVGALVLLALVAVTSADRRGRDPN